MKSYKLIKEYPGSDTVGTTVTGSKETMYSKGFGFRNYDWAHVEIHAEYWEEVIEKDYEVLIAKTVPYTILSVKRLSDGEVFTVGDRVRVTECGSIKTVDSIAVENISTFLKNGAWILYNTGVCHLDGVTKVKQPIFLTHDGKDIFPEDIVWYVNKENFYHDYIKTYPEVKFNSEIRAYFLTKEAAQEYVLLNKPSISINEFWEISSMCMSNTAVTRVLEELVKKRIC